MATTTNDVAGATATATATATADSGPPKGGVVRNTANSIASSAAQKVHINDWTRHVRTMKGSMNQVVFTRCHNVHPDFNLIVFAGYFTKNNTGGIISA
jgi:hypothetical protein